MLRSYEITSGFLKQETFAQTSKIRGVTKVKRMLASLVQEVEADCLRS
jgi:hypothetical protein